MSDNPASLKNRLLEAFRQAMRFPLFEHLLLLFTYNRPQSAFMSKLVARPWHYPRGSRRQITRRGITLEVDLSEYLGWYCYYGFLDDGQRYLQAQIRPGDTLLDIGGNNGELAMRLASLVGPQGRVVSFEPHPANWQRFQQNLSLNAPFPQLMPLNLALGDTEGELIMQKSNPDNMGQIFAVKDPASLPPEQQVRVPVRVLDTLLTELQLPGPIRGVKIDVEGFEYWVLRGAQQLLQSQKPWLFVEWNHTMLERAGSSAPQLFELLTQNGYRLYKLPEYQLLTAVHPLLTTAHFDIWAVAE